MSKFIRLPELKDIKAGRKKSLTTIVATGLVAFVTVTAIGLSSIADVNAGMSNNDSYEPDLSEYSWQSPIVKPTLFQVKLNVDGESQILNFEDGTDISVEDALDIADVQIDDDDLINVGLKEKISHSTDITIQRVEKEIKIEVNKIDYKTNCTENPNFRIGYSEVVVDGTEGEIETKQLLTYVDGEVASVEIISQEITDPVDEVVVKGSSPHDPISQLTVPDDFKFDGNGVPVGYSKILTGKSAAYSAKPGAKTASGRTAMVGYVAVDPAIIPYGTEMYITSTNGKHVYGYAIAADTGVALLDGRIIVDLFMESYEASCDWEIKDVNIYIFD